MQVDEWRQKSLLEVVSKLVDGSHNPPSKQETGHPMLSARNVEDGRIVFDSYRYIEEAAFKLENNRTRIAYGDVLLTIVGTIGRTAVVPAGLAPFALQRSVAVLTPKPELLSKFLCYQLQAPAVQRYFEENARGTAQKGVYLKTLGMTPIVLPTIATQVAVVDELEKQFSRLDEAVANLQRVKANLKRYKASVLKAAVEGRLVETEASITHREGRSFESGEKLLRRILGERRTKWKGKGKYKEPDSTSVSDLGKLPDGWTWASAVQVCEQVVDCHNKTAPYTSTGIPLVRTTNIKDGRLLLDDTRYVDQPTYEFWSRRCPPEPGDVLFTREAPMGEAGIIPPGVKLCLGQRTMLMRPSPAISSSFLLSALLSPVIKDLIDRVAVGSGVKHLRVGDVERLSVPLPPLAEQTRIVAEVDRHLSIVREVEAEVDTNLRRAHALRQSVLQRAFSGEMAAGASQSMQKVVAAVSSSQHLESASVVMAARIVAANCGEPTFGRVRLQKQLHLSTYIGQVATNDTYVRKQAGPLDMRMLLEVTQRLNELGWFRETERADKAHGGKAYSYSALTKADDYKQHLGVLTTAQQKVVDDLNRLMHNWTTEQCELFSTVYAAWNDLILWKQEPGAQAVADQLHNHWHESKKKFSAEKIADMMRKMTGWGYAPTGFGRPTAGAAADASSGELFASQDNG
ncbi:MAG: restriction endonuclease subunit S [Rhodoferax sp.]|uniref:restriction endonuclease subunit S n=1 Tax=Rhodoferax sp. TaxID=50421 RepID=UPI0032659392